MHVGMPAQPNDQEFSALGISGRTSWMLGAQQAASTPGAGVTVKLQNAEISALVSGLPFGPTISLAFGRGGPNMNRVAHPPALIRTAPKKFPTSIPTSRLNLSAFTPSPRPRQLPPACVIRPHCGHRFRRNVGSIPTIAGSPVKDLSPLPIGIRISSSAPPTKRGNGSDARTKYRCGRFARCFGWGANARSSVTLTSRVPIRR
jgi:hypothetical protein